MLFDGGGGHDGSLGLALQSTGGGLLSDGGVDWLLSEGGGESLPLLPYALLGLIVPVTKAKADIDDKSINIVNKAIIEILLCCRSRFKYRPTPYHGRVSSISLRYLLISCIIYKK